MIDPQTLETLVGLLSQKRREFFLAQDRTRHVLTVGPLSYSSESILAIEVAEKDAWIELYRAALILDKYYTTNKE